MDERRKTIRELEEKRREDLHAIDLILEDLGKTLLSRLETRTGVPEAQEGKGDLSSGDLAEYHRILKEIADSEEYIQAIEADTCRLKDLEEDILRKEQRNSEETKELSQLYARLGELLLEDPSFSDFTGPFRRQIEALVPKIKSLEDRLEDLEGGNQNNVFTWIGKSAQGMVIRSFLGKNQGNLQRIYTAVGEKFSSAAFGTPVLNPGVLSVSGEIEAARKRILELNSALNALRDERRKIGDSFGAEGGPVKRTQSLERHIARSREQLRSLYLRYGGRAAAGGGGVGGGASGDTEGEFASLLTGEDTLLLDKIGRLRDTVGEYDKSIEKLKASLAIDAERAEIGKMEKSIEAHRQRIAAGNEAISELERHIEESNRRIQELMEV
jgi:chromosome segregation ATPase